MAFHCDSDLRMVLPPYNYSFMLSILSIKYRSVKHADNMKSNQKETALASLIMGHFLWETLCLLKANRGERDGRSPSVR